MNTGAPRNTPLEIAAAKVHAIAAVLGGALLAIVGLMYVLWRFALAPTELQPSAIVPPPPRLERAARDDLAGFRARQADALESYAWADRERQHARIPIERAMTLLLEQRHREGDPAEPAR